MKVGIVTEYYYPTIGGVQDHVRYFTQELGRMGIDAAVITSHADAGDVPKEESASGGPRAIRIGTNRLYWANGSSGRLTTGWGLSTKFREILAEEQFDILHLHTPFVPTLPLIALKEFDGPMVGTFHTNFKSEKEPFLRRFIPLMRQYMEALTERIAVSPSCARIMRQYFGGRYRVIPNGIDVDFFASGSPVPAFGDGLLNLLFVGRLDPRNGLDHMIAAAAIAARQMPVRLLVMGDGPDRSRYETTARRALGANAVFLGTRISSRPDWYATADILCCPMQIASFGMVIVEGMAAGLPVIANQIDGFNEVIAGGYQGLLLNTGDVQTFADAIVSLGRDTERRQKLGEAGRRRAEQFAWRHVAGEITAVYRDILSM